MLNSEFMASVDARSEPDGLLEELEALKERRVALLREVLAAGRVDRAIGMIVFAAGVLALFVSVPRIWIEGGERIIGVILGPLLLGVGLHICWRPLPKNGLYYRVLALESEIATVSERISQKRHDPSSSDS